MIEAIGRLAALASAFLGLLTAHAIAQVPGVVENVRFEGESQLAWDAAPGADDYNVYRGNATQLRAGTPPRCHGDEVAALFFATETAPPSGESFFYVVTGESSAGEGSAGNDSSGTPRSLLGRCDDVVRDHALLRLGFGPDEWTRERLATLGLSAYLDEQLAPLAIAEPAALTSRLDPITPPDTINELIAHALLRGIYSRRQLEQQATLFWTNHFNTNFSDIVPFFITGFRDPEVVSAIATELQYRETNLFRDLAFTGTFREIVEASTLGPAMILFLDTDENVATAPNENMARELLELYALGVDGGYTQSDVENLARVLTGWTVCKKTPANAGDPLAPCIPRILEDVQTGSYVAHFRVAEHDSGAKTLFAGTPEEVVIPDTSASPASGVDDIQLALDAIADHPSTRRFISKKLLAWFATDAPTTAMIDDVAAAWQASDGSLLEVLRAVVTHPAANDPDRFRDKIKTPFEHVISAFRATRGKTNGLNRDLSGYVQRLQYVPYVNPVPTGYPEVGGAWIDTNNLLERQNFGFDLAERTANAFGSDLLVLMSDNGLTSASDPAAIVDFWSGILFAGALTPAERDEALTYLTTDENGLPAAPTDLRVQQLVGFLMGYPQFLEQ